MDIPGVAAELFLAPSDFRELVEELKDITGIRNHQELFMLLRLITGTTERSLQFWMSGGRKPSAPILRILQMLILVLRGHVREEYDVEGETHRLR